MEVLIYMEQLQEEYLIKFPDETFVTYRNMRIFYKKLKYDYKPWFVIIHPDHTIYPQSYCLGTHWGDSKEEVIQWALAEVDGYLTTHTYTKDRGFLPNFLLSSKH